MTPAHHRRMTSSSLMPGFMRTAVIGGIFLALNFCAISSIAIAKTYHRHHGHVTSTGLPKGFDPQVQAAQLHLVNLNYYGGPADGVMGKNTKAAIKKFQVAEHFPVTGKLTLQTFAQLEQEDSASPKTDSTTVASTMTKTTVTTTAKPSDFYATHPDPYGYVQQQYANPMATSTTVGGTDENSMIKSQAIPSRYGKIDVSEDLRGGEKRYNMTLNGQPLLNSDVQPAVIGISRTYQLNNEDAILVTTYRADSLTCPYKNYLLTFRQDGNSTTEVDNCTHGYQAKVTNGSLFITFPEAETGRDVGATWRYDNGNLQRL